LYRRMHSPCQVQLAQPRPRQPPRQFSLLRFLHHPRPQARHP
jgi:hypothetical protein